MRNNEKEADLLISWWGIDGFLVALYAAVVMGIFYAILTGNDFIIGKVVPMVVVTVTSLIFLYYLKSVFVFMRCSHDKKKKGN